MYNKFYMGENLNPDFDKKPSEEESFSEERIIVVNEATVDIVMSSFNFVLSLTVSREEDTNGPY